MFVLISYDITDDKKRTRLAKKLKDFGPRVQKSVFEADINQKEWDRLRKLLSRVPVEQDDSIRVYKLCAECKSTIILWGKGEVTEDKDFYIA